MLVYVGFACWASNSDGAGWFALRRYGDPTLEQAYVTLAAA